MSLLDKLKGKKKEPEQEIQVTTNIITKKQGKVIKETTVSNQPSVIKPDVYTDEDELEKALRSGNGKKGFQEKAPKSGVQQRQSERYDRDRLNALLAMDVDPDKRQTFTVTPKEHNLIMVIGDTLDEVMRKGESRDLDNDTVWAIFSKHRDLRAPSTWPEPGDNRNALIKAQEIMAEDNADKNFMNIGGRG